MKRSSNASISSCHRTKVSSLACPVPVSPLYSPQVVISESCSWILSRPEADTVVVEVESGSSEAERGANEAAPWGTAKQ